MKQSKKQYATGKTRRRFVDRRIAALVVIVVLLAFGFWFFTFHHKDTQSTKILNPKEPQGQTLNNPQGGNSKNSTDSPKEPDAGAPSSPQSTAPPKAPSGTFVSSHKLHRTEPAASLCNTTPGATCTITFKKGDTTKTLAAKSVGNSGAVEWSWNPDELGLETGSWNVSATATQNGQTVTTSDPKALEVMP